MHEHPLYVDGEWLTTGEADEIRSPFDGAVVGAVARGDAALARRAVDAAERAMAEPLPAWRRAEILDRVATLVADRRDELAATLVREAGKPITQARGEVARCASTYRAAAVAARTVAGEALPIDASPGGEGKVAFTIRVPVGVVGAIAPFNFPLNLVAHKIAPALAAGCATVLKPAPQAPLAGLALARLQEEAGLPKGWLNVVTGPAEEIGDVLVGDPRVALITFTGSAKVGWMLRERAPRKRVELELGNATPVIVAPDADLDHAAERIAQSAFMFAGQACISVQRAYVHRSVHDALLERLLPRVDGLVVGDPADERTDVGPVIDAGACARIGGLIDDAVAQGAEVRTGGRAEGTVHAPTVLTGVGPGMRIAREEAFGPVLAIAEYDELPDAIAAANATAFGLQAGIFTRDVASAFLAAQTLDFGGVTVNEAPSFRLDHTPYGGVKDSGNAKEGPARTVEAMTNERLVVLDIVPRP